MFFRAHVGTLDAVENGVDSAIPPVDRRWVLRTLALGGVSAAVAASGCGPSSSTIAAEAVDESSTLFTGAGGNVFATETSDGVLLVDTGLEAHADALLRAISQRYRGDRPVVAFNTHWHHDHTGGNAVVKRAGARIYAHENTRLWLQGDFDVPWENKHYSPLPAEMIPTDGFYVGGAMIVGGREVSYDWLKRAHTDGDVFVHVKDADILVVGDVVSVGSYPILDYATGGWIGELTRATEQLLALAGPNTKVVPGKGPVVGRDHLQKQFDMLTVVRDRLYAQCRLGRSPQEMLEARVTEEYDAEWGDPTLFVMNAYPGMWAHGGELGGVV